MALVCCPECGKEISDTAKNCPHCGYVLRPTTKLIAEKKKVILLTIVSLLVITIVGFAVKILLRPNISMDDFNVENNGFETLLFLGVPTEADGDEWKYKDCGIEFYSIPVMSVSYYISEGRYHLMFDGKYEDRVRDSVNKFCDYEGYVYIFSEYTYESLEVSVNYDTDFCFVHVGKN